MLSPNTILRERYRIIHQLGHGGMGAVYQAMDENLSCVVAVKETFAASDEQRRAFRREAELLANLSHPTLPRVMDHFTHGEGQFLVMQFVPGHDLAELLELREQPFAVPKVLDWADQLLDALEELHAANPPIIHRDIKPANLKVTPRGRILLLDFGLAKGAAGQMSTAEVDSHGRSIYGYTPNYAPLEQIRNAGTDARSDLYSLAATMWTLLTGRVPPDALTRIGEKEDGNPDPLLPAHEINPQVPLAVSKALNRALAVNRNQRPASAEELRHELREARQANSEVPTLRKERPDAPGPTALPPRSDSSMKPTEYHSPTPVSDEHHVPTMHVDAPPKVPSWSGGTTANSLAEEPGSKKRSSKPFAFIAGGALVLALAVGLFIWRPWTSAEQAVKTPATQASSTSAREPNASIKAPEGMAYVPGGTFMMGRDDGDEYDRPAHNVTLKPFFIDIHEFAEQDLAAVRRVSLKPSDPNLPEFGVNWDDANLFCRGSGKRLPTEEEWEFAARGTDGRIYPWGNNWQANAANAAGENSKLAEVGSYKGGASPFGAYDMVGNVWEWTASRLAAYPGGHLPEQTSGDLKVIRGGAYDSDRNTATATYRRGYPARGNYDYSKTGFRCVKDLK